MKKTLVCLFLAYSGIISAQNVNIPDANFKNYLLQYSLSSEPIDTNGDGEIQVTEALAVTNLMISEPSLQRFGSIEGIQAFANLINLNITAQVSTIDLSGLSQIISLQIMDDRLVGLNVSGLSSLNSLGIQTCDIVNLDLTGTPNLVSLTIYNLNSLQALSIGSNSHLESIFLLSDSLTALDLSGCPNISSVNLNLLNSTEDIFINLKNGNANYDFNSSAVRGNSLPDHTNKILVCIDEGEATNFENLTEEIVLSTYCSFTPGGNYNTIAGTFTYDSDNNGCDANDIALPLAKISINDGTTAGSSFTGSTGVYNFYTQSGNFVITPQFENNWFTANPAFVTVNLATVDSMLVNTHNFCITSNGVHPDVEVVIVPIGSARPGFDALYKVIYKNKGNQTLSGDVVFTYNDDVLDYVSASDATSETGTGSLTWNYTNLLPFETREITAILNVNGPMEIPAVNIGDVLTFGAAVTPVTGDESTADNSFSYKQDVVGSFDPNDLTCLEGETVNPDKIGEYLHYNINFENTGTAAATFIVVKDIIDAAKFDVNTLQIMDASHAMETKVTGNKVEFIFDAINLGAAEKGNVTFKIKTLETLAVNSVVTQQADIFFDYNWPIQTNEATTTFAILSSVGFTHDNSVKVYPNPADGMVTISAKSEVKSVQLYDVQGRLLQSGSDTTIDVSNRITGIYFIKIMTDKGTKVEKLLRK